MPPETGPEVAVGEGVVELATGEVVEGVVEVWVGAVVVTVVGAVALGDVVVDAGGVVAGVVSSLPQLTINRVAITINNRTTSNPFFMKNLSSLFLLWISAYRLIC
jgi:hypothetical protein